MSVAIAIDRLPLRVLPAHARNYLPDRTATSRAFFASAIDPEMYHALMDSGFRRSGRVIYQPVCDGCNSCVPIRIPVQRFSPSKSQRRCWRANQDLRVCSAAPAADDETFDLYSRYLRDWHGVPADEPTTRESFESFLYDSPVRTVEMRYRDAAGSLLAVGLCDVSSRAWSSVYFYHDPREARRGLGTFGALLEIEAARKCGAEYFYLGFWIADCKAMAYKCSFRPFEVLDATGTWREST